MTSARTHKIEEITSVGTSGAVLIGCTCGWVHRQEGPFDARKKARKAMAAHKAAAK